MRHRPSITAVEIVHTGTDDQPIVDALAMLLGGRRKEAHRGNAQQLNSAGTQHVVVTAQATQEPGPVVILDPITSAGPGTPLEERDARH